MGADAQASTSVDAAHPVNGDLFDQQLFYEEFLDDEILRVL